MNATNKTLADLTKRPASVPTLSAKEIARGAALVEIRDIIDGDHYKSVLYELATRSCTEEPLKMSEDSPVVRLYLASRGLEPGSRGTRDALNGMHKVYSMHLTSLAFAATLLVAQGESSMCTYVICKGLGGEALWGVSGYIDHFVDAVLKMPETFTEAECKVMRSACRKAMAETLADLC